MITNNEPIEYEEETTECAWCKEEYPESELIHEKDLGYICGTCARAIMSRGEKLHIIFE